MNSMFKLTTKKNNQVSGICYYHTKRIHKIIKLLKFIFNKINHFSIIHLIFDLRSNNPKY